MTLYDFFQEKLVTWFKDDYMDFSSKRVEGYSLFVGRWREKDRQAMVTAEAARILHTIFERYVSETKEKENDFSKSQISRWYVNGFTAAYHFCRRYDLDHPHKEIDYMVWAEKVKPDNELDCGQWDKDKFRKHTINLGRYEGTKFYMSEKARQSKKELEAQGDHQINNPTVSAESSSRAMASSASSSMTAASVLAQNDVRFSPQVKVVIPISQTFIVNNMAYEGIPAEPEPQGPEKEEKEGNDHFHEVIEYTFPPGLLEELYENYNGEMFRHISTLEEFVNILTRNPHTEHLSECARKKMQVYKLLYGLYLILPDKNRDNWLGDIAVECGYKVETIEKKHTGSDSSKTDYIKTMEQLDKIFSQYRNK